MGVYINKGNSGFRISRNGEYVDKSGLIAVVNNTLDTRMRFSCVSRCRRFGKSMAAEMLCAYYDKSCDSRKLFADLEIAKALTFEQYLNKYAVIYLDMTDFVTRYKDETIIPKIEESVLGEIREEYNQVPQREGDDLMDFLLRVAGETGERFIFIIDEWDAICREFPPRSQAMDKYVNWLRRMFKTTSASEVFAGVYMTGILPIKKYKTESALNNFVEYSMVDPRRLARYFGFTKEEVVRLASQYGMDYGELEKWYDGYQIGEEEHMFNPHSVMQALESSWCESYWGKTGAYEGVATYIKMNFDGLKDDVICMLSGGRVKVDPTGFLNDMSVVRTKDDVLTALIHLGYLSYDRGKQDCCIPNREVSKEMVNAVKTTSWQPLIEAIERSEALLQATLEGDEEAVARGIEAAHDEETSILSYNNENSLACVLGIAYYYAKNDYVIHRELASGKGFADLVMIPRRQVNSPALVVEMKCNKTADAAIDQIKRKQYPAKLEQYKDNLLLVGVNYDRNSKTHSCRIERG